MPRKKLTKAQVRRKSATIIKTLYTIMIDKLEYGAQSHWSMSFDKTKELREALLRANSRIK
jgi:hypothetical protein